MYAGFWIFSWAIWWFIIAMGSQGNSPAIGVLGLFALPFLLHKRPDPALPFYALIAFLVWATVSAILNGLANAAWIEIAPERYSFAIKAPQLLAGLAIILAGLAIWRAHHLNPQDYRRVRRVAMVSLSIVFLAAVVGAFAMNIYHGILNAVSDEVGKEQNLDRSANLLVIALPLFLAILPFRKPLIVTVMGVILWLVMFAVLFRLGSDAGLLALMALPVVAVGCLFLGRWMYRALSGVTVLYLLTTPVFMGFLVQFAQSVRDKLSFSAQIRLDGWIYVLNRIHEKWVTGWGIAATHGWREEKEYILENGRSIMWPMVSGHPHNMPLQIWAETGFVGVVVLCAFVVLLGEWLFRSSASQRPTLTPAVSIWACVLVYGSLSYSLWNDAFWMGIVFLSLGVVVVGKTENQKVRAA